VLLEHRPSLDFRLSFTSPNLLQGFTPQGGISIQLENNQLKDFLIIILLKLNDPLYGLNPIDVVLRFEVVIKLQYLNLEVTEIICRRTSPFNTSLFMVFMRRGVDDIKGVMVKFLAARGLVLIL